MRAVGMISAVLAATLAAPVPSWAQAQVFTPAGRTTCDVRAYSHDRDPAGANVRAGPSSSARVLGRLPAYVERDGVPQAPVFQVTASEGGWLSISGAEDDGEGDARPMYTGEGWISGGLAEVAIQSANGRSRPDAAAPVIVRFPDGPMSNNLRVERIVACQGDWVLVEGRSMATEAAERPTVQPAARLPGGRVRAWFRRACANLLTTCDFGGDPEDVR